MKVFYRISDGGYNKIKPDYVCKKLDVFERFYKIFNKYEIYVVADNVCEETYQFLLKYINKDKLFRTQLSNAEAFMYAVNYSLQNFDINEIVYFAEDDYLYTEHADKIILEGLEVGDYSSGYDHPDKYKNHSDGGPNPFIKDGGEITRVMLTQNTHWKITNSCCMTFAVKLKTIKEDILIIQKYCGGKHPHDFEMFIELNKKNKRKVVSSIPGVSTHGETEWLSPLIDWEKEFYKEN